MPRCCCCQLTLLLPSLQVGVRNIREYEQERLQKAQELLSKRVELAEQESRLESHLAYQKDKAKVCCCAAAVLLCCDAVLPCCVAVMLCRACQQRWIS